MRLVCVLVLAECFTKSPIIVHTTSEELVNFTAMSESERDDYTSSFLGNNDAMYHMFDILLGMDFITEMPNFNAIPTHGIVLSHEEWAGGIGTSVEQALCATALSLIGEGRYLGNKSVTEFLKSC